MPQLPGVYVPQIKTPGQADADYQQGEVTRLTLQQHVEQRQAQIAQAQRANQEQDYLQEAYQRLGGDEDALVKEAKTRDLDLGNRLEADMLKRRSSLAEARIKDATLAKLGMDADTTLLDRMVDAPTFTAFKPRLSPELQQVVGDQFDPERIAKLKPHGQESKERLDTVVKLLGSGNVREAILHDLAEADTPEEWAATWQGYQGLGLTPQEIAAFQSMFGKDFSPEGLARVQAAAKGGQKPSSAPNVGSAEDYILRKYGPNPTPEEITKGLREHATATHFQSASGGATAGGDTLRSDKDATEYAAARYRLLNQIPTRISEQDRIAIMKAAAAQDKLLSRSPVQSVQKQAAFKADSASLTKMTNMKSAAEAFENKAIQQADIVRDLSNKVSRSSIPLINSAILAGKKEISGDRDTQLLFNAITTFTSEYAKIMEGSTGSAAASSDSARRAAADLISAKLNKGTLAATLDLMKREMRLSIQGYETVIEGITDRMGGRPPEAPPTSPTGATKKTLDELLKLYGGKGGG